MRLIDADKIIFDYSGLSRIPPNDGYAIAKYFADQIKAMPSITPQPNAPLTLEELREMDGEAVWVEFPKCQEANGWMLISASRNCVYDGLLGGCDFESCGKTWLAYRRKPEEVTHGNSN